VSDSRNRRMVRIYEERLVDSVETFLSQLYREPWRHSEEMFPHARWEALRGTADWIQWELTHLWGAKVAVLIEEWKP